MPPYSVFLPNQPSRLKWNLVSPQPHSLMPTPMLDRRQRRDSSDSELTCCLAMSAV